MPNDLVRRETRCRRSHLGRGPSTAWRLFGEGFHHLLRGPFGARMFRDSEMKYLPPLMFQHEKHKQNPQADSRYSEEVEWRRSPQCGSLRKSSRSVTAAVSRSARLWKRSVPNPRFRASATRRECVACATKDWRRLWFESTGGPDG